MSKPQGYYEATKYLGMIASRKDKEEGTGLLQETACMDEKSRLLIANLEFVRDDILDPNKNKETIKMINLVIKYFTKRGHALWIRDTVTDMALFIGEEENVNPATITVPAPKSSNNSE